MKKAFFITLLVLATCSCMAQMKFPEGKTSAVILCYDDGLQATRTIVEPQLDRYNFKGTFFLIGGSLRTEDVAVWKAMARRGHELANHTLFHNYWTGRGEANANYRSLENYTKKDLLQEYEIMNTMLTAMDGREQHCAAYPWGQPFVGKDKEDFTRDLIAAGAVNYGRLGDGADPMTDPEKIEPGKVPCFPYLEKYGGADVMIAQIDKIQKAGGVGILLFHGVGADYIKISAEEHRRILDYLAAHPDIWVAPMSEVLDYVTGKLF